MAQNYLIRLRCPYGDMDAWIVFEERKETLEEVLAKAWSFECETHGVQREIPMEAKAVGPIVPGSPMVLPAGERAGAGSAVAQASVYGGQPDAGPGASANELAGAPKPENAPFSDGEQLRVPVVVYGWSKNQGTFHEESFTEQVNASGGLVPLKTKLEVGESCFVVNRTTHKEKEIRVVYACAEPNGEMRFGIAFKRPDAEFWKPVRKEKRTPAVIKVEVSGKDTHENRFAQTAYTVDVSHGGARLSGVSSLARPGQEIEVKRRWHGKARYKVVWVGQIGLEQANQIGICCLDEGKNIWGVIMPEADEDNAKKS